MSEQSVSVVVPKELNDALGLAVDLIIAAKWGKLNLINQLPGFINLLGELQAIPAEISGQPMQCEQAAALQLVRLVNGLINQP